MLNSFIATSLISMQISMFFIRPISKALENVNFSSGRTGKPTFYDIISQCLGLSPSFLKADNKGTLGLNY